MPLDCILRTENAKFGREGKQLLAFERKLLTKLFNCKSLQIGAIEFEDDDEDDQEQEQDRGHPHIFKKAGNPAAANVYGGFGRQISRQEGGRIRHRPGRSSST